MTISSVAIMNIGRIMNDRCYLPVFLLSRLRYGGIGSGGCSVGVVGGAEGTGVFLLLYRI